jgi:hypothetical protein
LAEQGADHGLVTTGFIANGAAQPIVIFLQHSGPLG